MDKTFCILIFFPYLSFLFLRSVDLFIIYFLFLIFISSSFIFLLLITSSLQLRFPFRWCKARSPLCLSPLGLSFLRSSPLRPVSSRVISSSVISLRWYKVLWQSSLLGGGNPVYSLLLYRLQSQAVWQSSRIVRCFSGRQSSYIQTFCCNQVQTVCCNQVQVSKLCFVSKPVHL